MGTWTNQLQNHRARIYAAYEEMAMVDMWHNHATKEVWIKLVYNSQILWHGPLSEFAESLGFDGTFQEEESCTNG